MTGELAAPSQLRMMFVRRALVAVPLVVLLGMASGILSGSADGNDWFSALRKPGFMPPGWAFPVAWTALYGMMGLALALVLHARGAPARPAAVALFALALALNLAWSPTFFAAHRIQAALWLIGAMFVSALATAILFARVRPLAGLLLLPYLAWLLFAAALNWQIDRLNPRGETLAPARPSTQISV